MLFVWRFWAYQQDVLRRLFGTCHLSGKHEQIIASGTLEFWLAADWHRGPGYDPVGLANADASRAGQQIAISGEVSEVKE